MTLANLARKASKLAIDNSPGILTGIGVAGVVTTAYLTGKASFKAAQIIDDLETIAIRRQEEAPELREKVELVWKLYIPATGAALLTILCVVGSNRVGSRRAAAIAAAYSVSEKAFDQYREKVVEKLGESKERTYRDEIAQDEVTNNPSSSREIIIATGGEVLCFDSWTGRYFESDVETLKAAQNKVNYMINSEFSASLSDFFSFIGLPATAASDEVGWNSDKLMEISFSATMADNNRPCIVVNYAVTPVRGFYHVN